MTRNWTHHIHILFFNFIFSKKTFVKCWIYSIWFSFSLHWIPLYGWSVTFQIVRSDLSPGSLYLTSLNSSHLQLSFPWLLFIVYSSTCKFWFIFNSQQLGNCPQLLTGWQYWLINIIYCYSVSLDKRCCPFRECSCLLAVPPLLSFTPFWGVQEYFMLKHYTELHMAGNSILVYFPLSGIWASAMSA